MTNTQTYYRTSTTIENVVLCVESGRVAHVEIIEVQYPADLETSFSIPYATFSYAKEKIQLIEGFLAVLVGRGVNMNMVYIDGENVEIEV